MPTFIEKAMKSSNTLGHSILAGLAGSVVLTGIHETLRRTSPDAPRMDLLGMQVRKILPLPGNIPLKMQPSAVRSMLSARVSLRVSGKIKKP